MISLLKIPHIHSIQNQKFFFFEWEGKGDILKKKKFPFFFEWEGEGDIFEKKFFFFFSFGLKEKMDSEEFAVAGRQMIDYVINYLENIRDRRVFPTVKPGFMRELIPAEAPEKPETWEAVFGDIERVIMPGVSLICFFSPSQKMIFYQKKFVLFSFRVSMEFLDFRPFISPFLFITWCFLEYFHLWVLLQSSNILLLKPCSFL